MSENVCLIKSQVSTFVFSVICECWLIDSVHLLPFQVTSLWERDARTSLDYPRYNLHDYSVSERTSRAGVSPEWVWWPARRICMEICNAVEHNFFDEKMKILEMIFCLPFLRMPLLDWIHEEELQPSTHLFLLSERDRTRAARIDRARRMLLVAKLRFRVVVVRLLARHHWNLRVSLFLSTILDFLTQSTFTRSRAALTLTIGVLSTQATRWWEITHLDVTINFVWLNIGQIKCRLRRKQRNNFTIMSGAYSKPLKCSNPKRPLNYR